MRGLTRPNWRLPFRQLAPMRLVAAVVALLWLLTGALAPAQSFPQRTGRVVDNAHVLQPQQFEALSEKLADFQRRTQRTLQVAIIPSLDGYPVEDYANGLFRAWQLGNKTRNDGVLLLIATQDHRQRIEVGYNLEPEITDALSVQIITEAIRPRLKANDWYGGIDAGVDRLIAHLQLPPEQAQQIAAAAAEKARQAARRAREPHFTLASALLIGGFLFIFLLPLLRRQSTGVRYGGNWGQSGIGQSQWGNSPAGGWGFWAGLMALDELSRMGERRERGWGDGGWSGGSNWGGDTGSDSSGGWGGGGDDISSGGGSSGGGGASGDW